MQAQDDFRVIAYVMRHCETDWNEEGRAQGWADRPLSPRGLNQAREAADVIKALPIAAVSSSDLLRAKETALIGISKHPDARTIPMRFDPDLRERHIGRKQGRTDDEIRADYENNPDQYYEDGRGISALDAEDSVAFKLRARKGLNTTLKSREFPALIVTHLPVLRQIFKILNIPRVASVDNPTDFPNGSITEISHHPEKGWDRRRIWVPPDAILD